MKMKFKDAPVGARFRHVGKDDVWAKIHSDPGTEGLVCSWDGNIEGFQRFRCFVEESYGVDFNTEVEIV